MEHPGRRSESLWRRCQWTSGAKMRGANSPWRKGNLPHKREFKCDECGRKFHREAWKVVSAHQFCSRSCRMKFTNKRRAVSAGEKL